jgi:hypothetical protein
MELNFEYAVRRRSRRDVGVRMCCPIMLNEQGQLSSSISKFVIEAAEHALNSE